MAPLTRLQSEIALDRVLCDFLEAGDVDAPIRRAFEHHCIKGITNLLVLFDGDIETLEYIPTREDGGMIVGSPVRLKMGQTSTIVAFIRYIEHVINNTADADGLTMEIWKNHCDVDRFDQFRAIFRCLPGGQDNSRDGFSGQLLVNGTEPHGISISSCSVSSVDNNADHGGTDSNAPVMADQDLLRPLTTLMASVSTKGRNVFWASN